MFVKPRFRLVPDNTRINFMRGRFMGLIVSAILSTASVVMFFYPGLNLGIDFSGGVVMEVRTQGPADKTSENTGISLSLTKALVEANRAQFQIKTGSHAGTLVEVTFSHALARA